MAVWTKDHHPFFVTSPPPPPPPPFKFVCCFVIEGDAIVVVCWWFRWRERERERERHHATVFVYRQSGRRQLIKIRKGHVVRDLQQRGRSRSWCDEFLYASPTKQWWIFIYFFFFLVVVVLKPTNALITKQSGSIVIKIIINQWVNLAAVLANQEMSFNISEHIGE